MKPIYLAALALTLITGGVGAQTTRTGPAPATGPSNNPAAPNQAPAPNAAANPNRPGLAPPITLTPPVEAQARGTARVAVPPPLSVQRPAVPVDASSNLAGRAVSQNPAQPTQFFEFDLNNDSRITASELGLDPTSREFTRRDLNNDGFLTSLEFGAPSDTSRPFR